MKFDTRITEIKMRWFGREGRSNHPTRESGDRGKRAAGFREVAIHPVTRVPRLARSIILWHTGQKLDGTQQHRATKFPSRPARLCLCLSASAGLRCVTAARLGNPAFAACQSLPYINNLKLRSRPSDAEPGRGHRLSTAVSFSRRTPALPRDQAQPKTWSCGPSRAGAWERRSDRAADCTAQQARPRKHECMCVCTCTLHTHLRHWRLPPPASRCLCPALRRGRRRPKTKWRLQLNGGASPPPHLSQAAGKPALQGYFPSSLLSLPASSADHHVLVSSGSPQRPG
jgi:hypothetical protein